MSNPWEAPATVPEPSTSKRAGTASRPPIEPDRQPQAQGFRQLGGALGPVLRDRDHGTPVQLASEVVKIAQGKVAGRAVGLEDSEQSGAALDRVRGVRKRLAY